MSEVNLNQNNSDLDIFIERVSKEEYDSVKTFFLNEYLRPDDEESQTYYIERWKLLSKLNFYFTSEEYKVDKEKTKLIGFIKEYFSSNYCDISSLYNFLLDTKKEFISSFDDDILNKISNNNPLEDNKEKKVIKNQRKKTPFINRKEENLLSFYRPNSDDDDINHEEFEMFMDSYGFDEEEKQKLRKKKF